MELRSYETVFIMTPVLSDDQVKDTVKKYKKILEDNNCEIVQLDKYKLRKLAYQIDHKSMGIYQIVEFRALPSVIGLLEKEFRIDEKIIRYLTVSLDKHGVEYNKKKREMDKNSKEEDDKSEETADSQGKSSEEDKASDKSDTSKYSSKAKDNISATVK